MKILIVEDEIIMLDALASKFTAQGFEVIKSTNGLDALNKALQNQPDLILLDIVVPKMNGLEMLRKLRSDKNWGAHAKVIILTNLGETSKIAEGLEAGLDGSFEYLIKTDYTLDEIVGRVKDDLKYLKGSIKH